MRLWQKERLGMDDDLDGRIPPDVVDGMACSADFWLSPGSEEKIELHRALNAYERAREAHVEPTLRQLVSELYVLCLPRECVRLLTRRQHEALERCALGGPFRACDD